MIALIKNGTSPIYRFLIISLKSKEAKIVKVPWGEFILIFIKGQNFGSISVMFE